MLMIFQSRTTPYYASLSHTLSNRCRCICLYYAPWHPKPPLCISKLGWNFWNKYCFTLHVRVKWKRKKRDQERKEVRSVHHNWCKYSFGKLCPIPLSNQWLTMSYYYVFRLIFTVFKWKDNFLFNYCLHLFSMFPLKMFPLKVFFFLFYFLLLKLFWWSTSLFLQWYKV